MAAALTKAGRYQIVGELGRGSMGVVYKGFDPAIGRTVAIKTMLPEGLSAQEFEEYKARFQREAMAAGILTHPNIITVYDFGEDNGVLYLAMEFLEGQTLDQIAKDQGVLPIDAILPIYDQVCSALDHAHRNMIIHRDVKPANIMILNNGLVKMTDFGIAKMMDMGMTQAGQILGTPNYMSPEQVKGRQIDGRSDIFSLGVILYEMITGEKPFGGQNITTVIYKIINENPIPPRELDASIPAGLSYIISKALAKSVEDRYQTCRELAEDLRNYKTLGLPPIVPSVGVTVSPDATIASIGAGSLRVSEPPQAEPAAPPAAQPVAPIAAKPPAPAAPVAPATPASLDEIPLAAPVASTEPPKPPVPQTPKPAARPAAPRRAALDETPIASTFDTPPVTLLPPPQESKSSVGWIVAVLLLLALAGVGFYVLRQRQKAAAPVVTETVTQPAPNPPPSTENIPSTPAPAPAPLTPPPAAAPSSAPAPTLPQVPSPNAGSHDHPAPASGKVGELAVSSNVSGARISIDGHSDPAWITPFTIPGLAPGVHSVEIAMDGYDSAQQSVTIAAGQTTNLEGNLSAPRAELGISTKPAGLTITIDGKSYGPSPVRATLAAGQHTYMVVQPDGRPYENTVNLRSGDIITRTLTFGNAGATGIVEIHTTPPGATVTADGAPVSGQTPTSGRLAVGNHTLVISLPGYKPVEQQVSVSENATATVNVNLTSQ